MNVKQIKKFIFTFCLIISSIFGVVPIAFASGDCGTGNNSVQCVSSNCSAISKYINANECGRLVSACENTTVVGDGINQTVLLHDTGQGNCSNAIRSCFEHEVNTTACSSNEVLAVATRCSNGNVNADGECGMDDAINRYNEAANGQDYTNNNGARSAYVDNQVSVSCANSATVAERRSCEDNIRARANGCYDSNGGTATKANGNKIQECMINGATTPGQCTAAGGQWVAVAGQTGSDTGGCSQKTTATDKKCSDGSKPNATTGKCADGSTPQASVPGTTTDQEQFKNCGEAQTVLIACKGTGVGAINDVMKIIINVITAMIGVAAVGGLAWASVLYAKAEDNAGNVTEARTLIRNIVIGLLLYGFLIAIINWLVPGGVIG